MLNALRRAVRAFRNRYSSPVDYWNRRYRRQGVAFTGPGCIDIDERRNRIDYEEKWNHLREALADLRIGAQVLDAGCGNGSMTQFLVERGFVVTAVDFAEAALVAARTRNLTNVTWVHAPLHRIDTSQRFDAVLCVDVIHHIVDDELFAATIERICRLANDDGICILQTHFPEDTALAAEGFTSSSHVKWRSRDYVRAALPATSAVRSTSSYRLPEEDATKEIWVIGSARDIKSSPIS